MPRVAKLLPIPRRYEAQGVQRYGFHGLSYEYLLSSTGHERSRHPRRISATAQAWRLCATGWPVDMNMAFTPAAGLVMSTRSGDIDPGLIAFLAREATR